MKCPKCENVEMDVTILEPIEFDRCPTCHGIWLDALELEKLLDADPKPLVDEDRRFEAAAAGDGPRLHCPRCAGTGHLIKLNSRLCPGTIIDSCTVCYGTWLDAGEFSRLASGEFVTWLRSIFLGAGDKEPG
jgi:Zn-finger nucleic acid-binding protein